MTKALKIHLESQNPLWFVLTLNIFHVNNLVQSNAGLDYMLGFI